MTRVTPLHMLLLTVPAVPSLAASTLQPPAAIHGGYDAKPYIVGDATSPGLGGEPAPTRLAPVEVRSFRIDATIKAQQALTPGNVMIVDGAKFHRRSVTNIADALRYVPGVMAVSHTGGDDGVLSIRGSNLSALSYANSGVALFQDGLPVSTADGSNHNRLLDPSAARYVIVANGANALAYGASVLGGAIDFVSPTARNADPRQLYLEGASYGLASGRLAVGGVAGDFDGMLTVGGKHSDGYRQHSRENRVSLRGNAGWRVSDVFKLRLFATYIDSRQQLAGSLTRTELGVNRRRADPSYALGNHQLNVTTRRLAATGSWSRAADRSLEFGVSYETQSLYHPIVDAYDFRFNPPRNYFSLLIDTAEHTAGGMLRYHFKTGNHNLLAGINLAHTVNEGANYQNHRGRRGAMTDAIEQRAGNLTVFTLDRWNFAPRWTLVYGAQGVVTDRDLRDVSLAHGSVRHQQATYASLNPRLGVLYQLGHDSEAFASVSRVYQAPSNFDLDNDVAKGNSTLAALQGTAWEIGTRGGAVAPDTGSWHWSLALYSAEIRNEILSVEDPTHPGTMLSTNYGHTIHAGAEARLGASFPVAGTASRLEPLVSVSWNHFRFEDDPAFGNNQLPSAPDYLVHGEVMYRNTVTGFYAGPTIDWAGPRYADMANTYRVNGYFLVGLRGGIQRDRWTLFAEARNLADRRYVNAISVRTRAVPDARVLSPGAPRSLFIGLRLRY